MRRASAAVGDAWSHVKGHPVSRKSGRVAVLRISGARRRCLHDMTADTLVIDV